jgi:hypothetical protein
MGQLTAEGLESSDKQRYKDQASNPRLQWIARSKVERHYQECCRR